MVRIIEALGIHSCCSLLVTIRIICEIIKVSTHVIIVYCLVVYTCLQLFVRYVAERLPRTQDERVRNWLWLICIIEEDFSLRDMVEPISQIFVCLEYLQHDVCSNCLYDIESHYFCLTYKNAIDVLLPVFMFLHTYWFRKVVLVWHVWNRFNNFGRLYLSSARV